MKGKLKRFYDRMNTPKQKPITIPQPTKMEEGQGVVLFGKIYKIVRIRQDGTIVLKPSKARTQ